MATRDWNEQFKQTHLCGGFKDIPLCEHFHEVGNAYETVSKNEYGHMKTLRPFAYYCKACGYKKIGSAGSWTGISPTWCPKRNAMEGTENEEKE